MTSRPDGIGYKPELDGIRAIAILLVLVFHTSNRWFPWLHADGGFMGVDLFFVLSGFLITSLLVREYAATGSISRRNFYGRRVLRLVPALILALAFGGIVAARYGNGAGNLSYPRAALTTFFFAGNWFSGRLGLITPLWSLGVEEQYYLIWPFVLIVALRRRVALSKLAAASAGMAALLAIVRSALFHTSTSTHNWPTLATFGWIRADGVFLGSALALVLASRHGAAVQRLFATKPLGYAAAICLSALVVRARFYEAGTQDTIFLLNCCAALVVGHLLYASDGLLGRVLRAQPLPAIGKISYALYIFQGPMLVLASHTTPGPRGAIVGWVGTFALALVSYVVVERPALSLKSRLRAAPRSRVSRPPSREPVRRIRRKRSAAAP